MIRLSNICTLLICLLLFSCNKNNSADRGNNSTSDIDRALQMEEIEGKGEIEDDLFTLIPVALTQTATGPRGRIGLWYVALRKPSGEYLMFDNEEDYSYLTPYFIQCRYIAFIRIPSSSQENIDEFIAAYNKLYGAVKLYLSGRKSEIKDKELFTSIDMCYYNGIKNSSYFYESKCSYYSKTYDDGTGNRKMCVTILPEDGCGYATVEGAPVIPEGAAVISL